jgi:hypothetical protein
VAQARLNKWSPPMYASNVNRLLEPGFDVQSSAFISAELSPPLQTTENKDIIPALLA